MTNFYDFEGALWGSNPTRVIRSNYKQTHRNIKTGPELCATLRAGEYAWPGGYQMALITNDSALLCFDCVREHLDSVIWSIHHSVNDGWQVIGCDIVDDYETESGEYCAHCSKQLASPADSYDL
jgi:hypothetical protein